ncbi:1-phosphofructokinase/6-phosphofructokinase 2 [Sporomusaceae bacterium BoRhaA]|uniref:1-phosphofructokinase family hexose kinase n=1 Tax=Pelorhabdus rhamnosifermentans TaxID=2772457 RepID=UPI001C062DD7|nr:1-phosphofructokinase [Pelorhabdus rhamnosifermentans]MBU2699737.1 1-phosphofructokinase/6-phosphofructokinase 2 [Pelorhabdus rhamnosifermentans]
MIYTLTMNPAIDMNLTGYNIKPNQVNRTGHTVYSPNGKGINVALVLRHFGLDAAVLGFFGGFTGRYIIDELLQRKVPAKPIWVEDTTRINIFINDGDDEFKFVNSGSFVPQEKQQELLELLENLEKCDCVIISGSLPKGISEAFYDELLELFRRKDIKFVLDISSLKLKDLLKYEPLLIKPNDDEIKEVFGLNVGSDNEALQVMRFLKKNGAQNVLLTMGERGSYFSNGRDLYWCSVQPIKILSSACAGDAALGAFLSEWLPAGEIIKALKKSAATGANVAESDALGDFSSVNEYMKNIEVRKAGVL